MNNRFLIFCGIVLFFSCDSVDNPSQSNYEIENDIEVSLAHENRILVSNATLERHGAKFTLEDLLTKSECHRVEVELSKNNIIDFGQIQLDGSNSVYELAKTYPFVFESQLKYLAGNELGGILLSRGELISNKTVVLEFIIASNTVKKVIVHS